MPSKTTNNMSLSDPCFFPVLADVVEENQPNGHAEVSLDNTQLEVGLRGKKAVELLPIFKAAWSLVLHNFCEATLVRFGVNFTAQHLKDSSATKVADVYQERSCYEVSVTPETTLQDLANGVGARSMSMLSQSDQTFNTGLSITNLRPRDSLGITRPPKHPEGDTTEVPISNVDARNPDHAVELQIEIHSDTAALTLRYDTAVLVEKQARDVASAVEQAVTCLLRDHAQTVGETSLVSPRNHDDISRWTSADISESSQMIHEIIREHSAATPEAIAVASWDGELTYHCLDMMSDLVAAHLAGLGVGAGVLVPVCFEKSKWFVVAALAVLKAGGCYVPLEPSHPVSRLHIIVHEMEAGLLLGSSQTVELFTSVVNRVMVLSDSTVADLPGPENTFISPAPRRAPAYILYTSGSTGSPKGCMMDHGALASVADSQGAALRIQSHSRVFQFASYSFGMALIEVFFTLAKGATVCIPSESERTGDIVGAYNRMQVTWAIVTPSLIKTIKPKDVPSLQTLVVAGEPLPRNLMQDWAPRVQLVQAYGLTEWAGICSVTRPLSSSASPANIGFPPNGRFWLVDPNDPEQLVPVGAVGEMLLEGPCLANGYFKQHEQTTRRFIPPPSWRKTFVSPLGSNHLYLTGDLMRYRPDGGCSYIGRTGTQVKIRGQRVELGEVEYHVAQQFGTNAKTVIAETLVAKGDDRPSLVAFILLVSAGDSQPVGAPFLGPKSDSFRISVQAASTLLSTILPRYMLPDFYVPLTQIPLTVSRKTSRKQLRELGSERTREEFNEYLIIQQKCRLPSTPAERVLHGIFAVALNRDSSTIGIDDSFFQLGGDSIVAMRAIVLCRKQQFPVTIQDIFRYRTVAELAKSLPINAAGKKPEALEAFDLSSVQQAFLQANPHKYNDESRKLLLRLKAQVDVDTVRYAVSDLSKRHSILRTKFERGDSGKWRQCTQEHSSATSGFRADLISDITEIPHLFAEMQATLDIEKGRVFTAALTECDSGERHLMLVAHYIVIDKESWAILCNDLDTALEGRLGTEEPPFPFRNWCQSQRGKTTAMEFTSLAPEQHDDTYSQNSISQTTLELDGQLSEILVGKANFAFSTQPIDIFHAALRHSYMKLLAGATSPTFFLEVSDRGSPDADTSNTVGWVSTIIPVQFTLNDESDVVELIRRAKDARKSSGRAFPGDGDSAAPMSVLLRFDAGDPLAQWLGQAVEQDNSIDKDMVPDAFPPLAMLDVTISFAQGQLKFIFRYHEEAIPSTRVELWMTQFELSLRDAGAELSDLKSGFTPGDLELPSISYNNLHEVLSCSPIQQGILLSQGRDPTIYTVKSVWKAPFVESFESEMVVNRFRDAWRQVLDRHAVLRTILVESHANKGAYDQVVLKAAVPNVDVIRLPQDDALAAIREHGQIQFKTEEPQHKLILCNTGATVYLGLIISHALIDAQSISIIMRDFSIAYDGKLPEGQGPYYGKYVSFLQDQDIGRSIDYWTEYLQGAIPCILPSLDYQSPDVKQHRELKTFDFEIDNMGGLQQFCSQQNITISNLFQLAWGLTLRCFSETDDVSFGYLAAGRDIDLDGMEDAVGPYINMLICRMVLGKDKTLREELQSIMHDFSESSVHQHAPLGQILSSLELSGPLFNTIISLRRPSSQMTANTSPLQLENVWELDPTEVSIVPNIVLIVVASLLTSCFK